MQETITQLFSYARGMWRYRWVGLVAMWLATLIAWAIVLVLPNKYESTARIQIDTATLLKPLLKGLTADNDTLDQVTMMTRTILSRPIMEKVARGVDLDLKVKDEKEMEELLLDLRKRVQITQPFDGREELNNPVQYFDVSFSDNNPVIAHKVVKLLLDILVEGTLGQNRSDTNEAQSFLQEQLKGYEGQLKVAEQRLAEFKKQNVGMLPAQGGGDYYGRMQSEVDVLNKLTTEYELAANRLALLKKQLRTESPSLGSGNPKVEAIEAQIADYEKTLGQLLLLYTDEHPDVQGVRRNIAQLEEKKQGELQQIKAQGAAATAAEANPVYQSVKTEMNQAEIEVQAYRTKLAQQRAKVDELKKQVDTMPEVEARLSDLNRDYGVIKEKYTELLTRFESAQLSEDVRSSNFDIKFQIIDPPVVPLLPASPNRLLFLSGATVAGVAVGLGLMFLLHMIFPVYITTRELGYETGYPVLGRVSMIFTQEQIRQRYIGYAVYGGICVMLLVIFAVLLIYRDTAVSVMQRLFS